MDSAEPQSQASTDLQSWCGSLSGAAVESPETERGGRDTIPAPAYLSGITVICCEGNVALSKVDEASSLLGPFILTHNNAPFAHAEGVWNAG